MAKLRLQLAQANKQTKENAKESLELVDAYAKLGFETAEAKREAKNLGAQLSKVKKDFGEGSKEALELGKKFEFASKKADALNDELKQIDASVGDYQRNVGNYSSALDGVKQGFSGVLELATPTGLAIAAAGLAIEGIGALAEIVKETNVQLKETAQLTGLSGQALDDYTAKVRASANIFDKEYKEVLQAANTLSKEFGISGTEAIDLINQGFVQGADINGDYLDQLREYSTQFKQAGLSAQDFNNVVALGAKEGIFGDKAADTVKEGGLRLREFTKATKDALVPLGELRNEEIKQAIASGNSFKAIQLVSKGLKEVSLDAQQTQGIITNVFGGPGEDAGIRFIELLGDIDTGQKTVLDNLTEQQKRQLKILEVEEQLAASEVKLGEAFKGVGNNFEILSKQLQSLGIESFLFVVDEIKATISELTEPFNDVVESIEELGSKFNTTGDGLLSFIKKFNPFTFVLLQFEVVLKSIFFVLDLFFDTLNFGIDLFKSISSSVKEFATSFDFVNTAITKVTNAFDKIFGFFTQTPQFLNGLKFAFKEAFNQIGNIVFATFKSISQGFVGVFKFDAALVKQSFDSFRKVTNEGGKSVAEAFNKGFNETIVLDVKKEEKKIEDKIVSPIKKDAAAKTDSKAKTKEQIAKEEKEKQDAKQKVIDDAAKQEQLKAIEDRNNDLINEQEYQDELLLIEVRRIEQSIALRESLGLETIEQQKALQQILLNEKKKGEEEGLKQEQDALKKSAEIDKAAKDAKKKRDDKAAADEAERRKKQQAQASDPIVQAVGDALETRIENELLLAGVQAFRSSIERGDETQVALQEGVKAVAAAQVFKSLAKGGFHDGGYTGDGNEYDVAGVVHKGEFVMTKNQTSKYGFNGSSANDFDNAVRTGYFNQFSEIDGRINKETNLSKQLIVNNNNKILVDAINELPKKMPKTDMSFYGKDLQQRVKEGNITKTTTFRGVR